MKHSILYLKLGVIERTRNRTAQGKNVKQYSDPRKLFNY